MTKTPDNGIYAIYDTIAQQISGGIYLHRHQATAVRFFQDIAQQPDTIVSKHLADFDLIRLGYLTDDIELTASYEVILKGSVISGTPPYDHPPQTL